MVYGGKPSTGCHLCRRRKIKCDEGHPGCRNCSVYGQPCPGYRSDVMFRNETRKVQELMTKGTTSGRLDGSGSSGSGSGGGSQLHYYSPSSLSVYRIPDTSWEEKAICYFFDQYTIVDNIPGSAGHLGFVPSLYAVCRDQNLATPASSSLRLAVDATSLIAMSNLVGASGSIVAQARNRFGLALGRLQEALNSPVEAVKDETFATLVILSLFEDISGDRNGLVSSHTTGFEALIRLRGENQLVHAQGLDMFKFAYVHVQVESLVLKEKPRYNSQWLVQLLDSSDPLQRLMIIAARISPLLSEVYSAPDGLDAAGVTKLASWIDSCRQLDAELIEWSHSMPEEWLPLATRSYTGEDVLTYREMIIGSIWAHYRCGRITIHLRIVDLFRALVSVTNSPGIQREAAQQVDESHRICKDLITESCQSIPFSFGQIDRFGNRLAPSTEGRYPIRAFFAHSMMWPLWFILSCGLTSPAQDQIIRSLLTRMGSELGIKMAFFLANTGMENKVPPMPDMSSFEQSMGNLYRGGLYSG
ncbi:Zn(II)2Cys6 transcription factor [Aspergillus heteromorphus CBS 117.55]|uniref:Zn(II)2Cys6 transcription factor n=1 Tax=Aspergillus heteromorphus CBS 117.55 TaxID=1448321 RepID=A0A317VEE7_9EURO|nr:Zn(II)2Cys6 transcription factor [Aspergillus heteromorphus CBS 117.55]PWY71641.1 Zn(II)2Cys6 transcription factor [Aspergillus heteromorphus CBS 117.55]